ncbi:hypothetical protein [Aeromonas hydrophila]|uniref:hypothetical protein n=1 Tax=Aeromonas hydrophila TaxID=644 RepID=UPI0009557988|nr:hypothetical protein [Aeromonas hydrophila]SIR34099.1 hypothetical protein SAMN05880569_11365 [Aeromonas hydrophila]SIR47727.1 hypothetical protein SAMN05878295_11165 [Aeromonas hydrophila]
MNFRLAHLLFATVYIVAALFVGGCAVTFVQPYDEKLLTDTEAIFKKASSMIDEGIANSPKTDNQRGAIKKPESHSAHVSKFEGRYAALSTDADALILRALSKAEEVDRIGQKLQGHINDLVENSLPSQCDDIEKELGLNTTSLTVKNYIDLKCLIVRWKAQHSDPTLTKGTGILKRTNWELRKSAIFSATLAIQKAETSKKK